MKQTRKRGPNVHFQRLVTGLDAITAHVSPFILLFRSTLTRQDNLDVNPHLSYQKKDKGADRTSFLTLEQLKKGVDKYRASGGTLF